MKSGTARRIGIGLIVALAASGAYVVPAPITLAQTCDPNYGMTPAGCVPGDRDYDCPELKARGIGDIPVLGEDWQRLDGYYDYELGVWVAYPDGLGCEWLGE